jgi:hypothetical protein
VSDYHSSGKATQVGQRQIGDLHHPLAQRTADSQATGLARTTLSGSPRSPLSPSPQPTIDLGASIRPETLPREALTPRGLTPTPTRCLPRKEVIQPQLPLRLPCYDFVPITSPTFDAYAPSVSRAVRPAASGLAGFHDVTGGVYKARERIHRGVLTHGY